MSIIVASRRGFMTSVAAFAGASLLAPALGTAQEKELTRGFERRLRAYASGEEINRQRHIWVLEIETKPVRMVFNDVTDPATGQTRKEQVWYLAYRAINRPLLNRPADNDTEPRNVPEPLPGPDKFIPALTLVTYENPRTEIPNGVHEDVIDAAALKQINRIERRYNDDPFFLDSVNIVQNLPEAVDPAAENQKWVYGVAMFKGVNPDTDFFKVIFRGFTNGYEKTEGPDGSPVILRKVGVQKFIRRGDRFDPNQAEFQFDGEPVWEYQPDREKAPKA